MIGDSSQRFTFVTFTNPSDSKEKNAKKRIRSAAAFSGWDKRLNRRSESDTDDAANVKSTKPLRRPVEKTSSAHSSRALSKYQQRQHSYGGLGIRRDIDSGYRSSRSHNITRPQSWSPHGSALVLPDRYEWPEDQVRECLECASCECKGHLNILATSARRDSGMADTSPAHALSETEVSMTPLLPLLSNSPEPGSMASGRFDPFNSYPVPTEPLYDWILHHMLNIFAPLGWPDLNISTEQGLLWERFLTQQALKDPALFYTRLLFASGDLVAKKLLRSEVSLWLRGQAVQAINEALSDPERAISDPLILAVGRIALHENMYGDQVAASTIHRPAQYRMIMMRGGMQALEFPGIVKRLMRWSDRIMATQTGTPRYLIEEESESWNLSTSITVLEKWNPHRSIDLRQKLLQGGSAAGWDWD